MPEQSPTLRDMIQSALDDGATFRSLEARAIDEETGKTASRTLFSDIVHGKADRVPLDYHLRAVAAALGIEYEKVRRAAIDQWIPPEDARRARKESNREEIRELLTQARQLIAKADEIERRGQGSSRESA